MENHKMAGRQGRRSLLTALLALCLAMCAGVMAGCSMSADEKKVQSQAEGILENIQALDQNEIGSLFSAAEFDPEYLGLTLDEFIEQFLSDFSYQIDDVATAANGDIWVTGTMRIVDGQEIEEALFSVTEDASSDGASSDEAASAEAGDAGADAVEETASSVSAEKIERSFSMAFRENASGEWELDAASFGSVLAGGWDAEEGSFL